MRKTLMPNDEEKDVGFGFFKYSICFKVNLKKIVKCHIIGESTYQSAL